MKSCRDQSGGGFGRESRAPGAPIGAVLLTVMIDATITVPEPLLYQSRLRLR